MGGCSKPPPALMDHEGPQTRRELGGTVRGTVIDNDGPVPFRHARQHPRQGAALIQTRKNDINHGSSHVKRLSKLWFRSGASPGIPYGTRTEKCHGPQGRSRGTSRRCRPCIRQVFLVGVTWC